jgi:hypothetical protein
MYHFLKNWAKSPYHLCLFHIQDAASEIAEQVTEFLTTGLKVHQLISMVRPL